MCDECTLTQSGHRLNEYSASDGLGGNSEGRPSLRGSGAAQQQFNQPRNIFPKSCINNRCDVEQGYTEGSSWKAFEVQDKVWLSSNEHSQRSAPFVFGCQTA